VFKRTCILDVLTGIHKRWIDGVDRTLDICGLHVGLIRKIHDVLQVGADVVVRQRSASTALQAVGHRRDGNDSIVDIADKVGGGGGCSVSEGHGVHVCLVPRSSELKRDSTVKNI
jgi:hypothetical protein